MQAGSKVYQHSHSDDCIFGAGIHNNGNKFCAICYSDYAGLLKYKPIIETHTFKDVWML